MKTILLLVLAAFCLRAQDPLTIPGFRHFYNLEFDEAIQDFEKAVAAHPSSPDEHNHLAQALQFRELLKVGALESELVSGNNSFLRRPKVVTTPEVEAKFFTEISAAMSLSQARLAKNSRDTDALYSLGVAYGLRANWNFLNRKAWRDALRDATESRKLHNRITEIDPSNVDARLTQGVHDYIVGSLPFGYRMLGFLMGFSGDRERGLATVERVAQKGLKNRIDAKVILCGLYRRERKWQAAGPLLEELIALFPRNYVFRFEQGEMYGALGDKEKALATLGRVAELKRAGAFPTLSVEKIYYHIGNLQFWFRDYPAALENLAKVTANLGEVDLNTATLAWMRIGQIYDLTSRRKQAVEAYRQAMAVAPEAEAARESRRYLSSPYVRKDGAA
jgi:tetratricopeptide (TPR) repeat protein